MASKPKEMDMIRSISSELSRKMLGLAAIILTVLSVRGHADPSVFPTGTTIYEPSSAWNGYTVLSLLGTQAVVVIDMNGRTVKRWDGFTNASGGPARVLPNGDVIAASGARRGRQESMALVQRDFDGNEIWSFNHNQEIPGADGQTVWSARQHHDWQREDFPAGYYSPEATPARSGANMLILTHTDRRVQDIADVLLQDDRIVELSPKGEIVWEWIAGDHIGEMGFDARARASIRGARSGGRNAARGGRGAAATAAFDWLHINSATYVGPNRWFDAGDQRFAPNNVIISSREASLIAIIARGGSIVWRLGPNFLESDATRAIGQIIGQHHAHLIPKGLPGAGNLLVFDNGGASGYGEPSGIAPNGVGIYARATSRILEIDPVTLKLVWSYTAGNRFFSTNISGMQRLPNGNTLITEGAGGRVFEVTSDRRIVWEYMSPPATGARGVGAVYRAYRMPYAWLSQLPRPEEKAVTPPPNGEFKVP